MEVVFSLIFCSIFSLFGLFLLIKPVRVNYDDVIKDFKNISQEILDIHIKIHNTNIAKDDYIKTLKNALGIFDNNYKKNYELLNVDLQFIDPKSKIVKAELTLKMGEKFLKKNLQPKVSILSYNI